MAPASRASSRRREAQVVLDAAVDHAQRQRELDGQVEVDVEELRAVLHRREVDVDVADVEAPQDGPLDLGPALAPRLVQIGVVPDVVDRAREPAVAAEEGGRVGDGAPAVELVLGVQGQVHADVLAPVAGRRLAAPGAGHHERGARHGAGAQAVEDADVGGMAEAEVVGIDDEQLGVSRVPEPLGQRRHDR